MRALEIGGRAPTSRAGPPSDRGSDGGRQVLRAGELEIEPFGGLVRAHGRPLALSVREHALLVALARARGRVISRGQLYLLVWGGELRPGDRSVDVYVSKLRAKLEAVLPDRRFIHTHFG
ncbi:MAG: winged helix-turn-helix transcriptional regulator, partial [Actinobacteria bacterium]